ncbi:MAG: carbohydrate ABC transporter permease [Thermofilum sp.]|jgi:multiple sugar transport system permease protein|nr:carbohydrate ABC transporter permease [Thermofilum sp.]MCC6058796.1 carbohydrate ABC transporter permease [Thermofilum sp.]
MRSKIFLRKLFLNLPIWIFAILWLLPFIALVIMSIKPYTEVILSGWWSIGGNYTLKNYIEVLTNPSYNFLRGLGNSFIISSLSTVIPIIFAAMLAYSLNYLSFKYKTLLFILILFFMSVPQQMVVIPLFNLYVKVGLHDTLLGIILLHSAWGVPWIAFFMRNYFKMIPQSLIEAARVDGAPESTIFFRILMPVSIPALIAASAIQFTWVWGDFFYAMVFLPTPANYVVTQRLALLKGQYHIDWGLLSAGAILTMLPPLLMYVAFKKYFVRGFIGWGVKG